VLNNLSNIRISLFLFLILQGCLKTGDDGVDDECIAKLETTNVTYAQNVQSIVQARCESCHGVAPNTGRSNLNSLICLQNTAACVHVNGTFTYTYDDLLGFLNLSITQSKHMPPNQQISGCDKFALFKWRDDGFL